VDSFDLRGAVLAALRAPHYKLTKGKTPQFCCPKHEDHTPSAWVGDGAWGCYACGFTEHLGTLADILGVEQPKRANGLTVADYADRKGFSYSKLTEWGVRDATGKYGQPVVVIPCYDADGKVIRERIRLPTKTIWGDGSGTCLYGLNVLAKAPAGRAVILVEGESDCHAGWHKGFCVVGVPGASLWKSDYAALFSGRDVYVWQEPDAASAQMAAKITADLPLARVIIAEPNGPKDIADLFKLTGEGFKTALQHRMTTAYPAGYKPPAITFDSILGGTLEGIRKEKLLEIEAVPTPYPSWNERCGDGGGGVGLARGWHITLAGNTGQGKSVVALNLAVSAVRAGESVCFVSLEMTQSQLATRYLAMMSGTPVFRLEQGKYLDLDSHVAAERAVQEIFDKTGGVLRVNRNTLSDLDKITEAILHEWEHHGCRYVIVDYMQLAYVKQAENDIARITAVSSAIRRIASEQKIITVGLSQFNRETSKDKERPPAPQGLMGGSALENDSHQVLLLNHAAYQRDEETFSARTELMLAKNRHGGQVHIPVLMDFRTLRVSEIGATPRFVAADPPAGSGEAWEAADDQPDLSFDPPDEPPAAAA
jgi:KaiC/GvpD/RAD55 family RecA-like ATPase